MVIKSIDQLSNRHCPPLPRAKSVPERSLMLHPYQAYSNSSTPERRVILKGKLVWENGNLPFPGKES